MSILKMELWRPILVQNVDAQNRAPETSIGQNGVSSECGCSKQGPRDQHWSKRCPSRMWMLKTGPQRPALVKMGSLQNVDAQNKALETSIGQNGAHLECGCSKQKKKTLGGGVFTFLHRMRRAKKICLRRVRRAAFHFCAAQYSVRRTN